MTDLSQMSRDDLLALQKEIAKALKTVDARRRKDALLAAKEAAQAKGFALSELLDAPTARTPVAAKYAHPENQSLTWSGRGRQPKWFVDALQSGMTKEQLAV